MNYSIFVALLMHFCVKKNRSIVFSFCIFEQPMHLLRCTLLLTLHLFLCFNIKAQKMNTVQYIEEFKFAAMQEMKIYGIPASVTLAQGILESASGNSKLAKDCNNHFGIKCRKNWTGNYCLADDDAPDECFRGYGSAMESYRDHSLFLKGASRYDFLFSLPATDYKAWAHGLRQAGYATNPAYGNIIISVVDRYRLSMYDSMTILGDDYDTPDTAASRLIQKHGLPAVIALKSQKPEDIAKLYDLGSWQIYKYNDLKNGEDLKPGEIIYLKPKKRRATADFHAVREGETLRDISQQHAVKLKKLEKFNQIVASKPLKPGEIIYLREKRLNDSLKKEAIKRQSEVQEESDSVLRIAKEGDTWQSLGSQNGKRPEELKKNNADIERPVPGQVVLISSEKITDKTVADMPSTAGKIMFHSVIKGETVYSISRLYKISPDSLIKWNKIKDHQIMGGQELQVQSPDSNVQGKQNQTHTVSAGETLFQISRRYGVSVADLQQQNGLKGTEIKVGQRIVIVRY